jgi:hypothetical protein
MAIIVFDWDDTLFPIFLAGVDVQELTLEQKRQLNLLDELIVKTFCTVLSADNYLFVVTNSVDGWIQATSTKYFPQTARLMEHLDKSTPETFCAISAKSCYASDYPGDPTMWKIKTFEQILNSILTEGTEGTEGTDNIPTFISIGDGEAEYNASLHVCEALEVPHKVVSTIEDPSSLSMLTDQLKLILNALPYLTGVSYQQQQQQLLVKKDDKDSSYKLLLLS